MVRLLTSTLLSVLVFLTFHGFVTVLVRQNPLNGLVVARQVNFTIGDAPNECRESCDSVLRDIMQICTTPACNCNAATGAGITDCVNCVVTFDSDMSHIAHIQRFRREFFSDCVGRGFPLDNISTISSAPTSSGNPSQPDSRVAVRTKLQKLMALSSKLGLGRVVRTAYLTTMAPFINTLQQAPKIHSRASGCGAPSPWQFDSTHHSNQTLGDRSFYVHIPASYNPNVDHAVVLSFHGFKGSDLKQEKISGFSRDCLKINNRGIIAVYPLGAQGPGKDGDSSARAWQGAPYAKPGVDDIAFTLSIINELKTNLCVDEKRIYAAGKSNGGGFTNLLACTPSTASLIAAFAPVSAALYPGTLPIDGCNPGRVVPMISIHGLADRIIPFAGKSTDEQGNTDYAVPAIPEYRQAWATRDGCAPTASPSISNAHELTTVEEWQCSSDNRAVVKGYTVQNLGHSWPTTQGLDGDTAPFDATPDDIVPFFDAHPFN